MRRDALFNFVPDLTFRSVLEQDYAELCRRIEAGCNKSALVLAGAILECVAIFYIERLKLWPAGKGDINSASLSQLIEELSRLAR
jgi:hypothetical protein